MLIRTASVIYSYWLNIFDLVDIYFGSTTLALQGRINSLECQAMLCLGVVVLFRRQL